VAQRPQGSYLTDAFNDFERAFDELFHDLLIARWRDPADRSSGAEVADRGDHYEVRMTGLRAEAGHLEIEATERRLIVRIGGSAARRERTVAFRHLIEAEAVSARFEDSILKVTLPKRRARQIKIA
jgi:HSP20 family molecular chaperone IbpA